MPVADKKEMKKIYAAAFVVFTAATLMCIAALYIMRLFPGQDWALLNDSTEQVLPVIRMFTRKFFSGEDLAYSDEIGLGMNTTLIYAFYAYSPVNLITLFVGSDRIALILMMAVKTGLSAFFMYLFIRIYCHTNDIYAVVLSFCYAFSGYQSMMLQNICLADTVWLLPFMALILAYFLNGGRMTVLSAAYALVFITHFYSGFLIGIFTFLCFIGWLILKYDGENRKTGIKMFLKYLVSVASAILISMIVLFPAISRLLSDTAGQWNASAAERVVYPGDLAASFFWGRKSIFYEEVPALYCGIPALLLTPLYFLNKKIGRREKVLTGIALLMLLLSIYIDPLYLFLHVFNRPDGYTVRFSILISFVCVYAAARTVNTLKLSKKEAFLFLLIIPFEIICVVLSDVSSFGGKVVFAAGNAILIINWTMFLFVLKNKNVRNICMPLLAIIECISAFCMVFSDCGAVEDTTYTNAWKAADEMYAEAEKYVDKGSFHRIMLSGVMQNQGARYGYPAQTFFLSGGNSAYQSVMFKMGINMTPFSVGAEGSTDVTDMLFSVAFRGNSDQGAEGIHQEEINERILPLVFMADDSVLDPDAVPEHTDPFEVQNAFLTSLLGKKVSVFRKLQPISAAPSNLTVVVDDDGSMIISPQTDDSPSGAIFYVDGSGEEHNYVYFSKSSKDTSLSSGVNATAVSGEVSDVELYSDNDRKGNGTRNIVLSSTVIETESWDDHKTEQVRLIDRDRAGKEFRYTGVYFASEDEEVLDSVYRELNEGSAQVTEYSDASFKAIPPSDTDKKIMFFSIPYDPSWKVYLDGIESRVLPAFGNAFCAVRLNESVSEVKMVYTAPGSDMAPVCAAVGLFIWLMLFISECRKKKACKQI